MKILILIGSANKNSHSLHLGQAISSSLQKREANTDLIDLVELGLPSFDRAVDLSKNYDEKTANFLQKAREVDAFVWVTPVYHNSYSSTIKNALDWLHFFMDGKVVGLASNGGNRAPVAIDQLMIVARSQHLIISPERVCTQEDDYEKSLGFALQLNLSMIHALGMKKAEAIAYFDHISAQRDTQEFETALAKQNTAILPFLSQLWAAFDYKAVTENEWFNTWQKEMTAIGAELQEAYKQKKLRHVDPNKAHQQNPLWYIYESYQHMNNNRLGIARIDEQYIAYILKRALQYEK
jgi:azobenzene reductase